MAATAKETYLLIIGEREALAWVLRKQRMAFPPGRTADAQLDDRLLRYTTRGCFHNPGRDRRRVIGTAQVGSAGEDTPPSLRPPSEVVEQYATAARAFA